MPLRGASPKRQKEYKKIKKNIEKRHEYPGREEEVAARIVNKQRRQAGETKGSKSRSRTTKSRSSSRSRRKSAH